MKKLLSIVTILGLSIVGLTACQASDSETGAGTDSTQSVAEAVQPSDISIIPDLLAGTITAEPYISADKIAKSSEMLMAPPTNDSAAKVLDETIAKNVGKNAYGTDRWVQSSVDADWSITHRLCNYDCETKVKVDPIGTPHLFLTLLKATETTGLSGASAKVLFNRQRPFAQGQKHSFGDNTEYSCRPDMENGLSTNGSYPSGHSVLGYTEAYILTLLDPDNAAKIWKRANDYAFSRVICNHHWYTDTLASRTVAAAAMTQLETDPQFKADLEAAKVEYDNAKLNPTPVDKDYTLELDKSTMNPQQKKALAEINEKLTAWTCDKEEAVLKQDINPLLGLGKDYKPTNNKPAIP
jgi:acid phosphatase (class A)